MSMDGGRDAHLVIVTGNQPWLDRYSPALETTITSLLRGEIIPIEQFYFAPPPPPLQLRPGQFAVGTFMHNGRQTCTSCQSNNPSVARLRYAPRLRNVTFLQITKVMIRNPAVPSRRAFYVEGSGPGQAIISATLHKDNQTVTGATGIQVGNDAMRIAVTSPRWGERFRQGEKNLIAWDCPECSPSAHLLLSIHNGDKSSGGAIAYLQPRNGSFIWNGSTVCRKEFLTSPEQCYDLRPGYYRIQVAVEIYGGDMTRGSSAFSAPFQILAPRNTVPAADVTGNTVKGFIATGDPVNGAFVWVQTATLGSRLVCRASLMPVDIPHRLSNAKRLFFAAEDLPYGVFIEAKGTWESAHAVACRATGNDPEAPPRLMAEELSLEGSGIFGTYQKCKPTNSGKLSNDCHGVSYTPLEISSSHNGLQEYMYTRQVNGHFLMPLPPGHYYVFGKPVDVKPSSWSRTDIKLPDY